MVGQMVAQLVKNMPARQETRVRSWVGKFLWRREWQSVPVFLPGEFHGQRSLVGYSPRCHKELDMTERLTYNFPIKVKENTVLSSYRYPNYGRQDHSARCGHRRWWAPSTQTSIKSTLLDPKADPRQSQIISQITV